MDTFLIQRKITWITQNRKCKFWPKLLSLLFSNVLFFIFLRWPFCCKKKNTLCAWVQGHHAVAVSLQTEYCAFILFFVPFFVFVCNTDKHWSHLHETKWAHVISTRQYLNAMKNANGCCGYKNNFHIMWANNLHWNVMCVCCHHCKLFFNSFPDKPFDSWEEITKKKNAKKQ